MFTPVKETRQQSSPQLPLILGPVAMANTHPLAVNEIMFTNYSNCSNSSIQITPSTFTQTTARQLFTTPDLERKIFHSTRQLPNPLRETKITVVKTDAAWSVRAGAVGRAIR
jgi:hypothetical protein